MKKPRIISAAFQALMKLIATKKPYIRQPGQGVARAEARLVEHRQKFAGIDMTHNATRQGQRAFDRQIAKMQRSARKLDAMKRKLPGGAAAVV